MAFATSLALIQSFCREYALPVPAGLKGTSDAGALQLRELLQTTGDLIWEESNWEQCSQRVIFSGNNTVDLGDIYTLCPQNMAHIVPDTFWNNTLRRRMIGPVSDQNWQQQLSLSSSGPLYYFRIANSRLTTSTAIPSTHSLTLIYKTKNWIKFNGVGKENYTEDNDVSVFSDKLMKAGLRAHWLRAKQMPHKYEFETFMESIRQEAAQNSVRPTLSLDGSTYAATPGIVIPLGNWTK